MRRRNTPAPKQPTSSISPVLVANAPPDADIPRLSGALTRMYAVGSRCIAVLAASPATGEGSLSGKLRLRHARHVDAHGENPAGLRQARELVRPAPLARRRHVYGLQIGTAEGAHRRAHRVQRKLGEPLAARREAHDLAAAIEGAPVAAFTIDGAAVGAVGVAEEAGEHALIGDVAARGVEFPGADRSRRGVGVIHRARVGAPCWA